MSNVPCHPIETGAASLLCSVLVLLLPRITANDDIGASSLGFYVFKNRKNALEH